MDVAPQLRGHRILVAQVGTKSRFGLHLQAHGADVFTFGVLRTCSSSDEVALADGIRRIDRFDWLVLTSPNTVEAIAAHHLQYLTGHDSGAATRIATVGLATRKAVERLGLTVSIVPATQSADGLAEALMHATKPDHRGTVLLPQSNIAPPALQEKLSAAGFTVEVVTAYEVEVDETEAAAAAALWLSGEVDAVVFASPSAANAVTAHLRKSNSANLNWTSTPLITLGVRTTRRCRELGFQRVTTSSEPSATGVLAAALTSRLANEISRDSKPRKS